MDDTQNAAPAIADNAALQPAAPAQTTAPADWRTNLPDDIKDNPTLSKFTDMGAFAKSYINLEKMLGVEKVPRPKGEFDPASTEWQMYLDAGGRPKSAAEYKFEEAKLPDGLPYDSALEGKFKDVAHMAGLNNKQATILRDMFAAYQAEAFTASQTQYKQSIEEATAKLQKDLGDTYEPTLRAAATVMDQYAKPELREFLNQSGVGNHPALVEFLGKIGKEILGETSLKTNAQSAAKAPADWAKAANEYRSVHAAALFDNTHVDHKMRSAELAAMMQKAFPE